MQQLLFKVNPGGLSFCLLNTIVTDLRFYFDKTLALILKATLSVSLDSQSIGFVCLFQDSFFNIYISTVS